MINIKTLIDRTHQSNNRVCRLPFSTLIVYGDSTGANVTCCCPDWLKAGDTSVRDIGGDLSIESLWNHPFLTKLRDKVIHGDYSMCKKETCPFLQMEENRSTLDEIQALLKRKGPSEVHFALDKSCNLACPSCRKDFIHTTNVNTPNIVHSLLGSTADTLFLNTSGEFFFNKQLLNIFNNLTPQHAPNLKGICLITNGNLATPSRWEQLSEYTRSLINKISFSVDTTKEDLYKVIRRGGHLPTVLENIRFFTSLTTRPKIRMTMVVQKDNYQEIENFVALGVSLGVDDLSFFKIQNWGVFPSSYFNTYKGLSPSEEEHVRESITRCKKVFKPCPKLLNNFGVS